MSNKSLIDEVVTLIEDKSNNNPAPQLCEIIGNYDDSSRVDIKFDEGILKYVKVFGTNKIGSEAILVFIDGDYNSPVVISGN